MHWIDPDSLPEIVGVVERFLLNPHGEADGMILSDGAEIHFPPHMGKAVVRQIGLRPRAKVRVRGVRPRGAPVFAAVSVETEGGERIEDHGPPPKHDKHEKPRRDETDDALVEGRIQQVLHGPKGERRGVLMRGGMLVRFPPHAAADVQDLLKPDAAFAARGRKVETPLGAVLDAREMGASARALRKFDKTHPKPKKPKRPHDHH